MEPMEEVPLKALHESELERLVRGWQREAGSWFQIRGEAYWKDRIDLFFVEKTQSADMLKS